MFLSEMNDIELPPALSAYKGLRGQILVELKRAQPLTAKALAERRAVSTNAIRRHLKELEVDRLVEYGRQHSGAGAPSFAYRLTADAEALFPKGYEQTLTEFLAYLEQSQGRAEVQRFFTQRYAEQEDQLRGQLGDRPLNHKLQVVADLLSRQGFMAEWVVDDSGARLAEHNCAMQAVAARYPELCAAEEDFLRRVLGVGVRRHAHIPQGCNACEYTVNLGPERPKTD